MSVLVSSSGSGPSKKGGQSTSRKAQVAWNARVCLNPRPKSISMHKVPRTKLSDGFLQGNARAIAGLATAEKQLHRKDSKDFKRGCCQSIKSCIYIYISVLITAQKRANVEGWPTYPESFRELPGLPRRSGGCKWPGGRITGQIARIPRIFAGKVPIDPSVLHRLDTTTSA